MSKIPASFIKIIGILAFIKLIILGAFFARLLQVGEKHHAQACFQGQCLQLEIAESEAAQQRGLAGREQLGSGEAMRFPLPKAQRESIWMKGVNFPLEILRLDHEHRILEIQTATPCDGLCPVYIPQQEARSILELPLGSQDQLGFALGDQREIRNTRKAVF